MSHVSVRPGNLADVETIVAFNAAMAQETEGRGLDSERLHRGVEALLRDEQRGRYYLAQLRGDPRVVGQLMVTREWSDWRCGWFWWIQSVYVLPAARGAGVYRALHEAVRAAARAAGDVSGIRLYVDVTNRTAQQVYRAVGMHETEYRLFEEDWSATPGRVGKSE